MANSPTLVARVSRAAHDAFNAYCLRRSSTVGEQLRQLVAEALEDDEVSVEIAPRSIGRGALRIELRLTPKEKRLIAQLAKEDAVSPQQWFYARLQDAGLRRDSRFVDTAEARLLAQEIERIMRSLLGMANNLNQVARALNSTRTAGQPISQLISPERLLVLAVIEKDLMSFVHRAHGVLEKLDNPRGIKPAPKKNHEPITRDLCERIRQKLDDVALAKATERS